MKNVQVQLSREWSGHAEGEIVTVELPTAESMVRKNYGAIVKAPKESPPEVAEKGPEAETADALPADETATVTPRSHRKRAEKGGH